jgi:hypothetical protein
MATGNNYVLFPANGGLGAVSSTGAGDPIGCDGGIVSRVEFSVIIATTGTVNFEHTVDGTNWFALACLDTSSTSQAYVTSCTASGIFQADITGSTGFRLNVAANGSSITALSNKVLG